MQLTEHFTLREMTRSANGEAAGIKNTPNSAEIENLRQLCREVLEPVRALLDCPIRVNSGFRNAAVNKLAGGVRNSQHRAGQAADIVPIGQNLRDAFLKIAESSIPFDQLIFEFDKWIHISYSGRKRRAILVAQDINGEVSFTKFNAKKWTI